MNSFQRGEKCLLTGLKQRPELNNQVVSLLRWNSKYERWEVKCAQSGENIRVREINLVKTSHNKDNNNDSSSSSSKKQKSPQKQRNKGGNINSATTTNQRASSLSRGPFVLNPCLGDSLNHMVRGGGDISNRAEDVSILHEAGAGLGQITRITFDSFTKIIAEIYGATETLKERIMTVGMILDYIGKGNDSSLVLSALKAKVEDSFRPENMGWVRIPIPNFVNMDTGHNLSITMINLREITINFIKDNQKKLSWFLPKVKAYPQLKSNRYNHSTVINMLLCSGDDNKSLKCTNLSEEIYQFGVYEKGGLFWHRVYVMWIMDDVLPTVSHLDAKEGSSLTKWHRLLSWEKQLTSSIKVNPVRVMLDVNDNFDISPWIEGLVSFDVSSLLDMPGVDTDRRIIRLAFFSHIAFEYSLQCISFVEERERQAKETKQADTSSEEEKVTIEEVPSSNEDDTLSLAHVADTAISVLPTTTQMAEAKAKPLKPGKRVVVHGLQEEENDLNQQSHHFNSTEILSTIKKNMFVYNGMEGRILSQVEDDSDYFRVSFTNLTEPQIIHASNLERATKVTRESNICRHCGGVAAEFLCSRCSIASYCSLKCQKADYKLHKKICKVLGGEERLWDLYQRRETEEPSDDEDAVTDEEADSSKGSNETERENQYDIDNQKSSCENGFIDVGMSR